MKWFWRWIRVVKVLWLALFYVLMFFAVGLGVIASAMRTTRKSDQ